MSTSAERMRRLRERRAAEIERGAAALQDADDLLAPAVRETLAALQLDGKYAAVSALTLQVARAIDEAAQPAAALRALGPVLLKLLQDLRATPMSRKGMKDPAPGPARVNRVAQMRAAYHADRVRRGWA